MRAETARNAFRRTRTRTSFEARDLPFLRAVWFASRHGAPFRPVSVSRACQSVCEISFRLDTGSVFRFRTAVASDRLLPPNYLSNRQPAFSVLVSSSGLRHSRDEEPDVSRRPSSLRPDRRFSMGFVAPGLTSLHVSRKRNTFRSWPLALLSPRRGSRAALSDDLRASHRGLGCVLPPPREGCRRRNNPKCLPSVARARAFEHVIDPGCPPSGRFLFRVSPTNWSGLVRLKHRPVTRSARPPSFDAVRDCHLEV